LREHPLPGAQGNLRGERLFRFASRAFFPRDIQDGPPPPPLFFGPPGPGETFLPPHNFDTSFGRRLADRDRLSPKGRTAFSDKGGKAGRYLRGRPGGFSSRLSSFNAEKKRKTSLRRPLFSFSEKRTWQGPSPLKWIFHRDHVLFSWEEWVFRVPRVISDRPSLCQKKHSQLFFLIGEEKTRSFPLFFPWSWVVFVLTDLLFRGCEEREKGNHRGDGLQEKGLREGSLEEKELGKPFPSSFQGILILMQRKRPPPLFRIRRSFFLKNGGGLPEFFPHGSTVVWSPGFLLEDFPPAWSRR